MLFTLTTNSDGNSVAKLMTSVFNRVENIVGKGQNAGRHHFLPSPPFFSKLLEKEVKINGKPWNFILPTLFTTL